MKKIFILVTICATAFTGNSFAQDPNHPSLLTAYYSIKDALVSGNAVSASSGAQAFIQTANGTDNRLIPEGNVNALVKEATAIAQSKDLKVQRERFADLSAKMFTVVKTLKLTNEPVHQAYCPMKKAYWLSSDQAIKNPYYGNAMLTCGKMVETINQ